MLADPVQRARQFWQGQGRCLASLTPSAWFRPRQDLRDEEWVATWREGLAKQAELPGVNVPSIYPDFGTISLPRYWGGKIVIAEENGNPFIEPVAPTIAEVLARAPRAVDDPAMDAARAVRLYRGFAGETWFRTPDLQGPLNTAAMLVPQEELLMALASQPGEVHALLDRISDFIIAWWQWLRRATSDRIAGGLWPYTFFPTDLGMALTEDMMPLLSPEMYAEFGLPVLEKLSRAAGGLQVHCCGDWGRHAPQLAAADIRLRAVEFHYPFTTIEELAPLAAETVFVPYLAVDKQTKFRSTVEYWQWLIDHTDQWHRYWFAACEDTPEMRAFVSAVSASR